jgi:FMN reductase
MTTAVVVGNPKPQSRTWQAAHLISRELTGSEPDVAVDLASIGAGLLDPSDATVNDAIQAVRSSDLLIVATPTYKGSYTGLLKLFLDRIDGGGLRGVVAVPLMLGGHWKHALAPEVFLKPVLAELGASCPTAGLFLLDSEWSDASSWSPWVQGAQPLLAAAIGVHA